jgi:UDP-N-acetylglucosamine/UDP-N-acetylgalactosamine diphosphorylase
MTPLDPSLLAAFTAANQQHVFTFYDELNETQRQQLLADARHIDPAAVNAHYAQVIADEEAMRKSPPQPEKLTPFTDVTVLKDASEEDKRRWYEEGLRAIADGRVATVLMAGGQVSSCRRCAQSAVSCPLCTHCLPLLLSSGSGHAVRQL